MKQVLDLSLRPENILPQLRERCRKVRFYEYYPLTTSTNDRAKEFARDGFPEIGVVVAEQQTAGRGRLGRKWISEAGKGLWTSILVRPQLSSNQAGILGLLAGLAVVRALKSLYRINGLALKWPNDVLISGRKLAGILVESSSNHSELTWAVIGIGINVSQPLGKWEEMATPPAFLSQEIGAEVVRAEILKEVLVELVALYCQIPFADSILAEYVSFCSTIGKVLKCSGAERAVQGKAIGVDASGALLVRKESGEIIRLQAHESSLRGALKG